VQQEERMPSHNDITGDALVSRVLSKKGEEAFEQIFGKKKTNGGWKPPTVPDWGDEASEKRQDIIGQNGNVGYEAEE